MPSQVVMPWTRQPNIHYQQPLPSQQEQPQPEEQKAQEAQRSHDEPLQDAYNRVMVYQAQQYRNAMQQAFVARAGTGAAIIGKQTAEQETAQRSIPFSVANYVNVRRANAEAQAQQAMSKQYYEKAGYPQYAGKYEPLNIDLAQYKVTKLTETPEGLKAEYTLRNPPKSFTEQYQAASSDYAQKMKNFGLASNPLFGGYFNLGGSPLARTIAASFIGFGETVYVAEIAPIIGQKPSALPPQPSWDKPIYSAGFYSAELLATLGLSYGISEAANRVTIENAVAVGGFIKSQAASGVKAIIGDEAYYDALVSWEREKQIYIPEMIENVKANFSEGAKAILGEEAYYGGQVLFERAKQVYIPEMVSQIKQVPSEFIGDLGEGARQVFGEPLKGIVGEEVYYGVPIVARESIGSLIQTPSEALASIKSSLRIGVYGAFEPLDTTLMDLTPSKTGRLAASIDKVNYGFEQMKGDLSQSLTPITEPISEKIEAAKFLEDIAVGKVRFAFTELASETKNIISGINIPKVSIPMSEETKAFNEAFRGKIRYTFRLATPEAAKRMAPFVYEEPIASSKNAMQMASQELIVPKFDSKDVVGVSQMASVISNLVAYGGKAYPFMTQSRIIPDEEELVFYSTPKKPSSNIRSLLTQDLQSKTMLGLSQKMNLGLKGMVGVNLASISGSGLTQESKPLLAQKSDIRQLMKQQQEQLQKQEQSMMQSLASQSKQQKKRKGKNAMSSYGLVFRAWPIATPRQAVNMSAFHQRRTPKRKS